MQGKETERPGMCRLATALLALLYVVALAIWQIGRYGLFGQERDPLAAVYLIMLGMPWVRAADMAGEAMAPMLAALAPLVNILIVAVLCRLIFFRRSDNAG